ncbi:TIGR03032 family protein [Halarcobacter sp.]|uniref:TIGR03032 family protein n=1 Tax=Halarcobacter sp. TaxID=2321133 RepID=UPI002AAC4C5F|nr:TIGR03032 family protein [Halarcobacter sp.]
MNIKSRFTQNIPDFLEKHGISIIFTSYSGGNLVIINSKDKKISQIIRRFEAPTGIALNKNKLAVSNKSKINLFIQDEKLADTYPSANREYEKLYYPIASYNVYNLDHHDLAFSNDTLLSVATRINAITQIDNNLFHNVTPIWKPEFISNLSLNDHCHLNGLAVDSMGIMRYTTAFTSLKDSDNWRTSNLSKGVLIDIQKNEIVYENLYMPHSPRIYKNELYVFSSATEQLLKFNSQTKQMSEVIKLDGYLRGLDFYDNYAFIGVSKLRKTHIFGNLPIANKAINSGIVIVDMNTKEKVGEIIYENGMEEVFDVKVIKSRKTNLYTDNKLIENEAIILPNFSTWLNK